MSGQGRLAATLGAGRCRRAAEFLAWCGADPYKSGKNTRRARDARRGQKNEGRDGQGL